MREIIESTPDAEPGSDQAKIAALYASFMDTAAVNAAGIGVLTPILERIDAIDSVRALVEFWGWSLRARHRRALRDRDDQPR